MKLLLSPPLPSAASASRVSRRTKAGRSQARPFGAGVSSELGCDSCIDI